MCGDLDIAHFASLSQIRIQSVFVWHIPNSTYGQKIKRLPNWNRQHTFGFSPSQSVSIWIGVSIYTSLLLSFVLTIRPNCPDSQSISHHTKSNHLYIYIVCTYRMYSCWFALACFFFMLVIVCVQKLSLILKCISCFGRCSYKFFSHRFSLNRVLL